MNKNEIQELVFQEYSEYSDGANYKPHQATMAIYNKHKHDYEGFDYYSFLCYILYVNYNEKNLLWYKETGSSTLLKIVNEIENEHHIVKCNNEILIICNEIREYLEHIRDTIPDSPFPDDFSNSKKSTSNFVNYGASRHPHLRSGLPGNRKIMKNLEYPIRGIRKRI